MERLLLALLKLIGKLVIQLIVFAVSGKWYKFDQLRQMMRDKLVPTKPAQQAKSGRNRGKKKKKAATFSPQRSPRAARTEGEEPWPFEFEPELYEEEPHSEEEALAREEAQAERRRRARARLRVPGLQPPPRSIASALRDRRTVRDALILGAALGPRRPRN